MMARIDKVARSVSSQRHSVLVVDDYPVREWMTRRLLLAELSVHAASTGEEALAIARRERLDLALIDYGLPSMDGVETAATIQKAGISIPWILFSAAKNEHAASAALQRGALRTVWTPFDVYEVVREALDRLAKQRERDWTRLTETHGLSEPGTTIAWAAWWILQACTSTTDLPRIEPWVRFVRTSYSLLRNAYIRIGVEPRDARDFMRILRALARTAGRVEHVEGQLALGDARTTAAMLAKAGLTGERTAKPITFEEFLTSQQFIPAGHPLLDELRELAARS